jgi:hypothetical protein
LGSHFRVLRVPPEFFVATAIALAARELGWITFPLPERRRQTEKVWAHEFGFRMASIMWGMHIGLGFGTSVTFGGFWVLTILAVAMGEPLFGATLMLFYWLGRVLSVWLAPAILRQESDGSELHAALLTNRFIFRQVSGVSLLWLAGIGIVLAIQTHWPLLVVRYPLVER